MVELITQSYVYGFMDGLATACERGRTSVRRRMESARILFRLEPEKRLVGFRKSVPLFSFMSDSHSKKDIMARHTT
jgi:hypothetical protein